MRQLIDTIGDSRVYIGFASQARSVRVKDFSRAAVPAALSFCSFAMRHRAKRKKQIDYEENLRRVAALQNFAEFGVDGRALVGTQ